jgi:hypothetical protein
MILVCNQKDGGDSGAAAEGLRTMDDLMMMRMMMKKIFYGGTGTNCTGTNGWRTATRRQSDDGNNNNNNSNSNNNNSNNTSRNTNDRSTVKRTPGARSGTVRRVHRSKMKAKRHRCSRMMEKMTATRRKKKDDEDDTASTGSDRTRMMNDRCATLTMETRDGHGDDLHQGRMEDDEDGGTPMLSETGTLDRKTGQATPMRQSATGTLDRKTDQAPPMTCFQPSTLNNETRPTTPDKKCRGHDEEAKDGDRTTMMRTAARRGTHWMTTDKWTPWYCNQGEAQITFSTLGPSGPWRGSVSTRGCDL